MRDLGKKIRLWELDAIRGVALFMMIAFHLIFDLSVFFGSEKWNYQTGFWYYEGRLSAILFILLAGIASSLIFQKEGEKALRKNIYRASRLLISGILITLITFIFSKEKTIWFGILHFLGISILMTLPLLRKTWANIILASLIITAHIFIKNLNPQTYLGIIFGFIPETFSSYDHYPLIPWLACFLIGIALGNWLYGKGWKLVRRPPNFFERQLSWIGRKSLWIYLLHQPVLLGALWLLLG